MRRSSCFTAAITAKDLHLFPLNIGQVHYLIEFILHYESILVNSSFPAILKVSRAYRSVSHELEEIRLAISSSCGNYSDAIIVRSIEFRKYRNGCLVHIASNNKNRVGRLEHR